MNNKYVKYFLIVSVIGVWTAIIYRIIHRLGPATPNYTPTNTTSRNELKFTPDTFNLYVDYPDPFLPDDGSADIDTLSSKSKATSIDNSVHAIAPITKETVAGIIQYNGIISNPQKKSRVGFITVHGKEYLVKERDKIEDITIKRIGKDKVLILYKGSLFNIEIH